jgi:hypothetical protein
LSFPILFCLEFPLACFSFRSSTPGAALARQAEARGAGPDDGLADLRDLPSLANEVAEQLGHLLRGEVLLHGRPQELVRRGAVLGVERGETSNCH